MGRLKERLKPGMVLRKVNGEDVGQAVKTQKIQGNVEGKLDGNAKAIGIDKNAEESDEISISRGYAALVSKLGSLARARGVRPVEMEWDWGPVNVGVNGI